MLEPELVEPRRVRLDRRRLPSSGAGADRLRGEVHLPLLRRERVGDDDRVERSVTRARVSRPSGRFEPRRSIGDLLEDVLDALEHFGEAGFFGQRRDAEVIAIRRVEARARRDQHVLLLEQLHRERLVVEVRELLLVDADERVHRAARRDEAQDTGSAPRR